MVTEKKSSNIFLQRDFNFNFKAVLTNMWLPICLDG